MSPTCVSGFMVLTFSVAICLCSLEDVTRLKDIEMHVPMLYTEMEVADV